MHIQLLLILVAFIWGLNPPAMKIGLHYLDPLPFSTFRLLAAYAFALLLFRRFYSFIPWKPEHQRPLRIASAGFFLFHLFLTYGLQHTTAANTALIMGSLPLSVALINHWHGLEKLRLGVSVGIVLSVSGMLIMIAGTGKEISLASEHLFGGALLLVAQFSYGYFTVFSRPLSAVYSPYQITLRLLGLSTFFFCLLSLPYASTLNIKEIPWQGWSSILYSGIFPLCLANCLWIWGISKAGSAKASLYNNLAPIFTVITGYFLLDEALSVLQISGALVIVSGLLIARKYQPAITATTLERKTSS